MADLKSFNATPIVSSSTRRARMIGGAATAAATGVLALMAYSNEGFVSWKTGLLLGDVLKLHFPLLITKLGAPATSI